MELRPYQQRLIEMARAEMREGKRRVLIVAPCGAGKTILSAFMCGEHAAKGGKILYLAHRAELLSQAAQTFERAGIAEAKPFKGESAIKVGESITVMSVQTAARRTGKMQQPTMIVVDECHHIASQTYQHVINAWPDAYVVGLTATPVRLDGKGLGDTFQAMVSAVDAKWLIDHHFLAPYRYFSVPGIDTSGLKKVRGDYAAGDMEALFSAAGNAKIAGDVIKHYKRIAEGQQAICYCPTVRISKDYAEKFRKAGISAEHMDGGTPKAEREGIVERFRQGEVKIICNVDLLGEGFDVPDCAVTIMLRPTASLSLYIQQAMRCMRYREGKRAIIIDHVSNYKRHGAPDADREWTLNGKKRKVKESDVPKTRTCPECYAELEANVKKCPECGYEFDTETKDAEPIEEDTSTELAEIKFRVEYGKERPLGDALSEAKSYADLIQIGRARGYKPGWAWHMAKQRGYIRGSEQK